VVGREAARTEADRLEPMGFQVDVLRWIAKQR
jgi:hypothetical protein